MDVDSYYYRIDSRNFVGSKVDQDQNTIVLSCLPGTISEILDYVRCERNGIIRSSHIICVMLSIFYALRFT